MARRARVVWALSAMATLAAAWVAVGAQVNVTLQPAASPTAAQPGVHSVTVTGSNFPAGTIPPANVTLTLVPVTAGAGPTGSAVASAVQTLVGSTRRITFQVPPPIVVTSPTAYRVSVAGTTSTGVGFVSGNASALTVTPPSALTSVVPVNGVAGQSLAVSLTATYTNFVQGSTQASFGSGISVGGGAEGGYGPVTVTSPTQATAQVVINAAATAGPRTVAVRTGVQQAARDNGFTVVRPNQVPTASAGGPYSVRAGDPLTFNATGSSDPDGDPLTYAWTFGDGGTGSGATPTHTYASAGTFTATVTVSDGRGGSQSASAEVVIRANQAPTVTAGGPYTAGVGEVVAFTATANDADGDPLTYDWMFGDGGTGSGATPTHSYATANTFTVTVTVNDGRGGTASASAQAIITDQPAVLTLTIAEPPPGRIVPTSPITVRGMVSDPTSRVAVQNTIASVIGTTFEARNIGLTEGVNQILAQAVIIGGARATANVNVTLDSTPPALSVVSPPDRSIVTATIATVSATVSDATALTCSINGAPIAIQSGLVTSPVTLVGGSNVVSIVCQDAAGHTSSRALTLFQDPQPLATLAINPVDGATGVSPTAPIEIRFSEPVDPATVTTDTVIVRTGNTILPVSVSVSPDGLVATVTPVVPFPQGTAIVVTIHGIKDATGNPLAVPFTTAFATDGTPAPPGVVVGEVYDDRRSLPLAGATVEAVHRTTRQVLATTETDERGKYLLDPGQADFVLRISKPTPGSSASNGFTVVERATAESRGSFAEAMDARLTARGEPRTIQALLGGTVPAAGGGEAVVIPPGAFDVSANVSVSLTSVSGQGSIAVFPPGWTPISIVDFEAPEGATFPATLRLIDRSQTAGGRTATLARYDRASASWLTIAQAPVAPSTPVEFTEQVESGQFALLVPDEGAGAPAVVQRGQPLSGSTVGTIPVDAQATGQVNPPVGRADDPTPALATVDITSPTPLRSGTLLRGDFMEVIVLRGGGQVSPLDTSQDFVAYRSLEDTSGRTLVTSFPIAPSRVFDAAAVTDGSITVRLSRGLASARSVIGAGGGGVSAADGSRVVVPPGALAGNVPVDLRRLDSTTFPISNASNVTFVGGLELNLSSATAALPLTLSLSGGATSVPTGSTVVVAEVRNVKGVERLVMVALGEVNGSELTSVARIGSVDLSGVRHSGRYGFYRFDGVLGAVTGTARDAAGRRDGHIAELANLPFVSITDNVGRFVLASQSGAFDLTATAADSSDQARASGTTGTALPEIVIGPTPPRVEAITVRLPPLEGDFAGPVSLLGKPAPLVDDDSNGGSAGNANGQIEAGERIELMLFVRNDGTIPIQGGFFVLEVRGPPAPIQVQPANLPLVFLAPDEPFSIGPFVFSVPAGTNPASLRYRLAYANNGGLANSIPFGLPLGVDHPNVSAASDITIRFSEPVVRSSLNSGISLSREDGANLVPLETALVVAPDNQSMILRPLMALAGDTVYRITLTSQIVDADGRPLANAPYVERFLTADRTPPPLIPAGQIEASVPDEDGFVTITGSPGSVNPDDIVIGLNATTGFSALAEVRADGSFIVRVRADVTDELSIIVRDRNDNSTTVNVGALIRRDPITGRVLGAVVGRGGGTVSTEPGIRLIVPAGAAQSGTELSASRLSAPFQLPADLLTNAGIVAAFNARFTIVDRVRITSNVTRFAGPIRLSMTAPQGAAVGDRFVVWRSRTVTFGGPLADLDLLTGIRLADNPIVTAERLEIVESATVKSEGSQLVLSTDSPPFPGITEPGDYTIAEISGPLVYFAGEVRRDTPTGPVVPGVAIRSRPDALPTSPFAAVTDSLGRFLVADGSLTGPFESGAAITSRLDVFDEQFTRVIRREVRGIVGPPAPPGTVVAHLREPFVLPTRLPPEITEILGDLEPPRVELVFEGPTFEDGQSGVLSPLKVTVIATDNDEVVFVGLEVDQGFGLSPVALSPERTFEITPPLPGLLVFRAQARDPSDNSTFEDAWVRIGPVIRPRPSIVSVDPPVGHRGQSLQVAITGRHTHFAQDISQVGFGPGIVVSGVTVTSPTQLVANVRIDANAARGARTVAVATDDESVTLPGGFNVVPCTIAPDEGQQGQTLQVTITCRGAPFVQGVSSVDLGAGITVSPLPGGSPTQLTVNVEIAPDATVGRRDLIVTMGNNDTLRERDIFRVKSRCEAVPGGGQLGQKPFLVTITCLSTHFVDGVSIVDFGPDIDADKVSVQSPTRLTAIVTIRATAAVGTRTVTVTTNGETVTLPFNVSDSCSIAPDRGAQGAAPLVVTITCLSSNFVRNVTTVNFGQGIIAGGVNVLSPLQLRTTLGIADDAQLGDRVVNVTTGSETRTIFGFTVIPSSLSLSTPFVFLVPPVGHQGQTLLVTVFGSSTNFEQGVSQVSFGAGITTSILTVADPTTLTVQAAISFNAAAGPRTVSVITNSEVAQGPFTVLANPPPVVRCGTFDGTVVVEFWTPIDRATATASAVRFLDADGNPVPHSLHFEPDDTRIIIAPDRYLRLGATYRVVLTGGITSSDGIPFDPTTRTCDIAPPELITVIGKDDGGNPPRDDVVAINGEIVEDVATVGDTVAAVTHPRGSAVGDLGHLHTFQLRFANNGTFEKIDTLATVPVRGRPLSLATDGAIAYVGNRFLGPIATKQPFVTPIVEGAAPLVFPDVVLGCEGDLRDTGFGISGFITPPGFVTTTCTGLSQYWYAFPQPASNLEVFDLGNAGAPVRLGAAPINSGYQLCRAGLSQVPGVRICDVWDPNTWPNRVEVTSQGVALHNFLNNVEFFSPTSLPTSFGVVGQIKRYGEVTPRGPDGRLSTADDLHYEFLDATFFDGFAVALVQDGLRIVSTSPLGSPENSTELGFESVPGAHGARLGGVQRFQWGGDQGVDTTSDLAFVTTTDNTLTILDVTQCANPVPDANGQLRCNPQTLSTLTNTFGNMSFDACRGVAYIHGRFGEFHVIDFNDPLHPVELNLPDDATQVSMVQTSTGRTLLGRNVSFNGNTNRNGLVYLANDAGVAAVRVLVSSPAKFGARDACGLRLIPERPVILVGESQVFIPSSALSSYRFTLSADSSGGATIVDNGNGTATYTAGSNPGSSTVRVDDLNSPNRFATATPHVVSAQLKEVTFERISRVIASDDGRVLFEAPHWQDNSNPLNGTADPMNGRPEDTLDRNYPVAYVRAGQMWLSAKFVVHVDDPSHLANSSLKVRAVAASPGSSRRFDISATHCVLEPDGRSCRVPSVSTSVPFDDSIGVLDPLSISWEMSFNGHTWVDAGTSRSRIYITWATPLQGNPIETLLHVGASAASGSTGLVGANDDRVLDAVWTEFQTKTIRRVSDERLLTYYGFLDVNDNGVWDSLSDVNKNQPQRFCNITASSGLTATGNGQCFAWAEFMNEVLRSQGLSAVNGIPVKAVAVVAPQNDVDFAVKNWTVTGASPWRIISDDAGVDGLNPSVPNPNGREAADARGVSGQGTSPNPPSRFNNHWILKVGDRYYDPSYGLGPFFERKQYEEAAFAGLIYALGNDHYLTELPPDRLINNYFECDFAQNGTLLCQVVR